MVIGTSNVAMTSHTSRRTSYTENRQVFMRNIATGEKQYSQNAFSATYEYASRESNKTNNARAMEDSGRALRDKSKNSGRNGRFEDGNLESAAKKSKAVRNLTPGELNEKENLSSLVEQLRVYMFSVRNRLQLMIGRNNRYGYYDDTINLVTAPSSNGFSLWRRTEYTSYTYEEQEEMTFATKGKAVTADGREIEFNMELGMSREFVEESESLQSGVVAIMTDPLVINLTDNPVSISDQKWLFDIDSDGEEDSISMLSEGSGYLVLDKNGDGVVNDGSEMFGSKTGNGFAELAAYDEDGNGWIDENDSVYSKLSVWVKDSKGNDNMLSLKDSNVGAIYLGSVASEFALKSSVNNDYNAQVRRSGMYLSEDGNARSIQQLDMVKALIS